LKKHGLYPAGNRTLHQVRIDTMDTVSRTALEKP